MALSSACSLFFVLPCWNLSHSQGWCRVLSTIEDFHVDSFVIFACRGNWSSSWTLVVGRFSLDCRISVETRTGASFSLFVGRLLCEIFLSLGGSRMDGVVVFCNTSIIVHRWRCLRFVSLNPMLLRYSSSFPWEWCRALTILKASMWFFWLFSPAILTPDN